MAAFALTDHQRAALDRLRAFATEPGARCFVLRGYAGTGKTTLVGHFVRWLEERDIEPVLLATTGRAAKVLAEKTGRAAQTIHSRIYQFDELAGLDAPAGHDRRSRNERRSPSDARREHHRTRARLRWHGRRRGAGLRRG